MKKLFRIGLLTAIFLTMLSSAMLFTRIASAHPAAASAASNKNKNRSEHTKEMKRELKRKKLILKGRHEKHKAKHTQ